MKDARIGEDAQRKHLPSASRSKSASRWPLPEDNGSASIRSIGVGVEAGEAA